MKNFYEATVIKPTLKLEVALHVKPVGNVKSRLQINDASWIAEITEDKIFKHKVCVADPINIQIQINRRHPEALEITLEVEGHKILPTYQERLDVTCYLDNNTIWTVKIPNFYSFYHEITGQGWII